MSKLIKKLSKIMVIAAAAVVIFSPALAAAAGETYYWQNANHQAVVGTGGVFSNTASTFTGPEPNFTAKGVVACSDGSGKADLTVAVTPSDYKASADPTPATVTASCDTVADNGQVSIYASAVEAQAATSASSDNASCKGGVLAWILCPVYNFILSSIQSEEKNVIAPFLQLTPLSTSSNSPPYEIWSQFRNLADIGFIIAFLVIIFAHTLSLGIDSYSLKKTLPRLVYAAILVQFSFLLVAAGVDIANILGAGVQAIVLAPLKGQSTLVINGINGGIGIAVGIGVAFAALGSVITGSILVVLVGAFFAVLGVFLTLIARQILVTLLLIISPLAFVAWVLPNTEHLFKIWRTSLIRLLLMYPMIILLFSAGKLFSTAAIATGSSGSSGATANAFLPLISIVANIIPLFFIPLTFKYSGSALNAMSGWINAVTTGAHKRTQSSQRMEQVKTRTQQRKTELAAGEKIKFMGASVGGSGFSKQLGRGPLSIPGKGSDVRALVAFNKDIDGFKKRLTEENMTYEGLAYLSLGDDWYNNEHAKIRGKISAARAVGDMNEVNVQTEALKRTEEGKKFGGAYRGIMAARSAAFLRRSDMDVMEDKDRVQILEYTGANKDDLGRLLGNQLWERGREGARKTNVHLVHTDARGNLNVKGLEEYVAKKPASVWVDYTKDAITTMRDSKILEHMAQDQVTRQILVGTLSSSPGASIGAEQQRIIREVLTTTPYDGPPVNHDVI